MTTPDRPTPDTLVAVVHAAELARLRTIETAVRAWRDAQEAVDVAVRRPMNPAAYSAAVPVRDAALAALADSLTAGAGPGVMTAADVLEVCDRVASHADADPDPDAFTRGVATVGAAIAARMELGAAPRLALQADTDSQTTGNQGRTP